MYLKDKPRTVFCPFELMMIIALCGGMVGVRGVVSELMNSMPSSRVLMD